MGQKWLKMTENGRFSGEILENWVFGALVHEKPTFLALKIFFMAIERGAVNTEFLKMSKWQEKNLVFIFA